MSEKLEQLLQEYETDNSLKQLNDFQVNSYEKLYHFYSEEESISINEYFNIFQAKLFLTKIEVCEVIQQYVYVAKYNLKRNQLKNKSGLTFVCSCISKKQPKNRFERELDADSFSNNLRFEESNAQETSKHNLSRHRQKRLNNQACKFRLKFKYSESRQGYLYSDTSYIIHNHDPDPSANFKFCLRNVKFPLALVLYVFQSIIHQVLINKSSLSKDYIKSLKIKCISDYSSFRSAKANRMNISKKLMYFLTKIKTKIENAIRYKNAYLDTTEKLTAVLFKDFLAKTAGNYLELQDIQALAELLESDNCQNKTNNQLIN